MIWRCCRISGHKNVVFILLRVYNMLSLPPTLRLASDPVARNKCVVTTLIKEGSAIFTEESFVDVLLTREKGKRCDACFCLHKQLKKCSGCGWYWYCDAQCESRIELSTHRWIELYIQANNCTGLSSTNELVEITALSSPLRPIKPSKNTNSSMRFCYLIPSLDSRCLRFRMPSRPPQPRRP